MEFKVIRGFNGELYLTSSVGHCHTLHSITKLLKIKRFIENNSSLIPYFEKGKQTIENNEVGIVKP